MKQAASLKGISAVLIFFVIASIAARPQFMTSEESFEGEGHDIEGRHFHRHHFRPYNHRQPFVGNFGPSGVGMMPFGAGHSRPNNHFFGPTIGGGGSATGLGIANSGFGGGSAIGLGTANSGFGGNSAFGLGSANSGFGGGSAFGLGSAHSGLGGAQATGIGIANNAPAGGFGLGMGLGLAISTPFGNMAQSEAISFG